MGQMACVPRNLSQLGSEVHMGHRTSSEVLPGLPRIDVPCCVCLGSEEQAIWPVEQVPRGSEGLPCLPCIASYGPSVSCPF